MKSPTMVKFGKSFPHQTEILSDKNSKMIVEPENSG